MIDALKTVLAVVGVLFAIGGLAAIVALSSNYEGVMTRSGKVAIAISAVLIALSSYAALF